MRSNRTAASRKVALAGALALVAICSAAFAAPARAATGSGHAVILTAEHDRGRSLSAQGGKLIAGKGTSLEDGKLTLPLPEVDPGEASAGQAGNLAFRKGKRGVALAGIHFDFAADTLNGLLGGQEMAVFTLGAAPVVDPVSGAVSLSEGELRLTADAAKIVRKKLGLKRALRHNGIGMIWIAAQADPTHSAARAVTSGEIDWGFKESWRSYVLAEYSPGSAGTITVEEGATATGPLSDPASTYVFPAAGGSFVAGLYGAGDTLTVATAGAVKWAKPAHGINEVRFSDLEVELSGGESWLVGDVRAEIGPPAEMQDVRIAELDTAAVNPAWSADGNTVTWSEVPATLTAEGAASFSGFYEPGTELDPVTITAGLG